MGALATNLPSLHCSHYTVISDGGKTARESAITIQTPTPAYYKNNLSALTRHRSGRIKRQVRPPGPCATFCATFIHAHLSAYYEYPPKKQASSNTIKRGNRILSPLCLPIPPHRRPCFYGVIPQTPLGGAGRSLVLVWFYVQQLQVTT